MLRQIVIIAILVTATAFLVHSLRTSYLLSVKVAGIEAAVANQDRQQTESHAQINRRLDVLDEAVFGTLPQAISDRPAPEIIRPPAHVQLWQRTRDSELRKRLKALEEWRLAVESGKQ
jgi:hypothetical protein